MSKLQEFLKKANPNLTQKLVLVHPKMGRPFYRKEMVRQQAGVTSSRPKKLGDGKTSIVSQKQQSGAIHGHHVLNAGYTAPTDIKAEAGDTIRIEVKKAITDGNSIWLIKPEVLFSTPAKISTFWELSRMIKSEEEEMLLEGDVLSELVGENPLIEKGNWKHKHDNFPKHPVRVIDHIKYFATHAVQQSSSEPQKEKPKESPKTHYVPVEILLRNVTKSQKIGKGVNNPEIVELEDDGKAVFKYKSAYGEPKYEVSAFLLSEMLNLDIVPTTSMRSIGEKHGSIQQFVDADIGSSSKANKLSDEDLIDTILFDYLIDNPDRHDGNWLLGKNGRIIAIDNGGSFSKYPYVTASYQIIHDKARARKLRIPDKWRKKLSDISNISDDVMAKKLGNYISSMQAEAMRYRADILLQQQPNWNIGYRVQQ